MSTRATYHFAATDYSPAVTFYIHHDGYQAGAAHYLALMLSCDNERGGWACQFLRANDGAEITSSHKAHGDTEFRYTMHEGECTVTCHARGGDWDNPEWQVVWFGDIAEFIAKHAEWETTPKEFSKLGRRVVTRAKAEEFIAKTLSYAQEAYFQGWIGNASGSLAGIRDMRDLMNINQKNILAGLDKALKERFATA